MCVPSFRKNCAFTSHPFPHPCHASSLHLQHETPPSCFIHLLSVFDSFTCASLPLQWLLVFFFFSVFVFLSCVLFLYKKTLLSCFSASLSLSVCLCPCGCLPGCLAAGGPWGHPVGDLIKWILRGEALPLSLWGPNRRELYCCLFLSLLFHFHVSVSLMSFPSVYPHGKM